MLNALSRNLKLCFPKINLPLPQSPPSIANDHSPPSPDFFTNITAPVSSPDYSSDESKTPDFATAIASSRFFFSYPGRSNSIVHSSPSSSSSSSSSSYSSPTHADNNIVDGGVAIQTYSPDPYIDFRRSMHEMVEARGLQHHGAMESWDQLHELLTCYLTLNPKCAHKFILAAFADLLVSLMSSRHDAWPSNVT